MAYQWRPWSVALASALGLSLVALSPRNAAACGTRIDFTQDCCTCTYSFLARQCVQNVDDPCDICYTQACSFPGAAPPVATPGIKGMAGGQCPAGALAGPLPAAAAAAEVIVLKART